MSDALSPHKVIKNSSYGAPGFYSSKTRAPPAAVDCLGKLMEIKKDVYQPAKNASLRNAHVGRQLYTSFQSKPFGKVEYVAEVYSDKGTSKANTNRKIGFTRSSAMGRDEVSSIYDVLRYRQQLNQEVKTATRGLSHNNNEEEESSAAADAEGFESTVPASPGGRAMSISGASDRGGDEHGSSGGALGHSLRSRLPQVATDFDRSRHVPEFTTKTPREIKYARDYGTSRPTSQDIGEGASDPSVLSPPEFSKKSFTSSFGEKPHLDATGTMKRFA